LEKEELVLDGTHMILGDSSGRAVFVEWASNRRVVYERANSALVLANFLYSNPSAGNFPCPRTTSVISNIGRFERKKEKADLLAAGNFLGRAVQLPVQDNSGRWGGTLYTAFIDYGSNVLILVPRLQNEKIIQLNLNEQFKSKKSKKVRFKRSIQWHQ
jgi:choloylglycine hydrolase